MQLDDLPVHPLHKLIGAILTNGISGAEVICDVACGGSQNVQLFCQPSASRASRICMVDAAIVKNGQVKAIIEVEESDIRPVALCGKVFVCLLASHFIHSSQQFPLAERVSFVQIISTSKLGEKSSKLQQCRFLEESINAYLQAAPVKVKQYAIFHGGMEEFSRPGDQRELVDLLSSQILL